MLVSAAVGQDHTVAGISEVCALLGLLSSIQQAECPPFSHGAPESVAGQATTGNWAAAMANRAIANLLLG